MNDLQCSTVFDVIGTNATLVCARPAHVERLHDHDFQVVRHRRRIPASEAARLSMNAPHQVGRHARRPVLPARYATGVL